jgi:hypothetical protein
VAPAVPVDIAQIGSRVFLIPRLEDAQVLKGQKRVAYPDLAPIREDTLRFIEKDVSRVNVVVNESVWNIQGFHLATGII